MTRRRQPRRRPGTPAWLAPLAWAALLVLSGCGEEFTPLADGGTPVEPASVADPAPAAETAISPADPAPDKPAAAEKTPQKPAPAAAPRGPRNITFDDVKLPLETNDDYSRETVIEPVEELDGRSVRIRGYILPSFQQTGIQQFVLVRDNLECCFGPGAALYDCILVDMNPGKTTDFTVRPVTVEGVFSLRELLGPDGKPLAIYHLQADAAR